MATRISDLMNSNSMFGSSAGNSLFGNVSGSYVGTSGILGDFAAIKNGSYKRLLKAYYAEEKGTATGKTNVTGLNDTEKKQVTLISSDMSSLKSAADALKTTGSKSLFKVDEEGKYNMDELYKAAKSLVDSYNSALTSTSDISISVVDRKMELTANMVNKNAKMLKDIGISITEGKLSIDETKFKEADINKIKTAFNGSNSIAARLSSRASDIYSISQAVLGKSPRMYGSTGVPKTGTSTGNLFNKEL